MATHSVLRVQIVREGALEPLILAARAPSIEVQRETAAALCNMALAEENKVIMARGGALPAIISLAMSGDNEREVHAAAALANISEMVEGRTQERMLEEGALKPLMRLADSSAAEIRREVARAFALFASKRDSHTALVRAHAASRMMTFLADKDEVTQRFGVLGDQLLIYIHIYITYSPYSMRYRHRQYGGVQRDAPGADRRRLGRRDAPVRQEQ
jgi:hypothetical protein